LISVAQQQHESWLVQELLQRRDAVGRETAETARFVPKSLLIEAGTRLSNELEVLLRSWEARGELFDCERVKRVLLAWVCTSTPPYAFMA
jgi:hypothetical protein